MYKPGGTIAEALNRIQSKTYVLPAIQREFVWKPEQIEKLFDSLMQGYPFGTFPFWKVESSTSGLSSMTSCSTTTSAMPPIARNLARCTTRASRPCWTGSNV